MKMRNEKRLIGGTRELVGTAGESQFYGDYELKCPDCGTWTRKYGDYVVTNEDNTESYLCDDCGRRLFYQEGQVEKPQEHEEVMFESNPVPEDDSVEFALTVEPEDEIIDLVLAPVEVPEVYPRGWEYI